MKNLCKVTLLLVLALAANAQTAHIQQLFYTGSSLQYVCEAPVNVASRSVSKDAATFTSVVVSSNVGTVTTVAAHQLWVGARVTISGSASSPLNASYVIATVPSTTTYTIATSGVVDGTYATGITVTTNSPMLNSNVWSVQVLHYDSGGVLDGIYYGGSSANYTAKCSDRALF